MYHTYAGNIHIHSTYSDGSGSFVRIAAAAAAAGLSYIIITDHETLQGLTEEGIHDGVKVLVGVELNRDCNHYLALGLKGPVESNDAQPQEVIDRVNARGGFGFIAHPFERGSRLIDGGRAFPWIEWPVENFCGLEIWNYSSYWRGRATSAWKTIYWFIFNRKGALDAPPPQCLQLWDCYTGIGRRIVGIGGTDAHAVKRWFGIIPVEIFPYRYLFRTINTYLLLPEKMSSAFSHAKEQIYEALRQGRCYISFDELHPGRGFFFSAAAKDSVREFCAVMGEEIRFTKGLTLTVKSPSPRSLIRIIKKGQLVRQANGAELHFTVPSPGVYRAEVYYRPLLGRPRPWIFANPIYLSAAPPF